MSRKQQQPWGNIITPMKVATGIFIRIGGDKMPAIRTGQLVTLKHLLQKYGDELLNLHSRVRRDGLESFMKEHTGCQWDESTEVDPFYCCPTVLAQAICADLTENAKSLMILSALRDMVANAIESYAGDIYRLAYRLENHEDIFSKKVVRIPQQSQKEDESSQEMVTVNSELLTMEVQKKSGSGLLRLRRS